MTEIRLPFPPSVNEMYVNRRQKGARGRMRSPVYTAWIEQAGWELKAQRVGMFAARAIVMIDIDESRQGDCGNREKAVTDLLVAHGVLRGDQKKYVKRVSIGWEPVTGCRVKLLGVD